MKGSDPLIYFKEQRLVIRSMVKDDIEKIVDGFAAQHWSKRIEMFEDYYMRQLKKEHQVFVALLNEEVAGFVLLTPKAIAGPFAQMDIPEIVDLNVFKKYQHQGIGNALMDVAERAACEFASIVCLAIGLHASFGAAQRLYVKRGYIPDGSGVWYRGLPLDQYAQCINDDDLMLHLSKSL